MEIIIHQAILHVLDTTLDAPVLSGSGMEMTAEKTAYLQNHIEKLLASDEIRQCRPLPDSEWISSGRNPITGRILSTAFEKNANFSIFHFGSPSYGANPEK